MHETLINVIDNKSFLKLLKFHFLETIRLHSVFVDIPLKYSIAIIDIAVNQEYIRLEY